MAIFTTNVSVSFDSDFALLSVLTDKSNYSGFTTTAFVADSGMFLAPTVTATGSFHVAAKTGALHSLMLSNYLGEAQTITHLSLDLDTLIHALNGGIQKGVAVIFAHNDTITGSSGFDVLRGYGGDDRIYGGGSEDTIYGGAGNDTMHGGAGNDGLFGQGGNDRMLGEAGGEGLVGGAGDDVLRGGADEDNLEGDAGRDTLDGGSGVDSADFAYSKAGVTIALHGAHASHAIIGGLVEDTLIDIEWLYGGAAADHFTGDARDNALQGAGGADVLRGGGGDDTLYGDIGGDKLFGGTGGDDLNGGAGKDILSGGGGFDRFWFSGLLSVGGVDTIQDFVPGGDRFLLSATVFGKLTPYSVVDPSHFALGAAQDGDDYIIYDRPTGRLFYDDDGNGADKAHLFAILANHAHLTAGDLAVL